MDLFENKFKDSLKSNVSLLDRIMHYIIKRKGKQMRPMFVFLTAKLFGKFEENTYRAASMIELLHTATLVHDDVIDEADFRRGFFSINALWKNKIAVLVGDYLLAQGLLLALDNNEFQLLKIVSKAVRAMSEGELLQMEKARRLDIKEDIYYDIIEKKTASLIAAACMAGGSTATKEEETLEKMYQFGLKIGIAFQIRDDLFDFGTDDVGKPLGIDIKEKKMTLPLIYALENTTKTKKRYYIKLIKKHNEEKDKVAEVIEFVRESGGLDYAQKAMYEYRNSAFEILDTFEKSETREALRDLVNYVTERKK
jgi:octaprenyl-diphosphate synthase